MFTTISDITRGIDGFFSTQMQGFLTGFAFCYCYVTDIYFLSAFYIILITYGLDTFVRWFDGHEHDVRENLDLDLVNYDMSGSDMPLRADLLPISPRNWQRDNKPGWINPSPDEIQNSLDELKWSINHIHETYEFLEKTIENAGGPVPAPAPEPAPEPEPAPAPSLSSVPVPAPELEEEGVGYKESL
jgi:hypothetical protein